MTAARAHVIADLRSRIAALARGPATPLESLPFGVGEIDAVLPGGGLARGALHEFAGGGAGAVDGAAAALFVAGIAARTKGKIVWCLTRPDLFFPALAQAGLDANRVIFVEGDRQEDVLASMEEALSYGGLGAVVGSSSDCRCWKAGACSWPPNRRGAWPSSFADGAGRRKPTTSVSRPRRPRGGASACCRRRPCRYPASGGQPGCWS